MDRWVAQLGVVTEEHREIAHAGTLRTDAAGQVALAASEVLRNRELSPFIVNLGNEAGAKGIGMIAINSNDPKVNADDSYDVMKTRAKERGMKYAYAYDATSEVARAFGATRTPEAFLFDANGKLVYHGTIDDNADDPAAVKDAYLADAGNAVASGKSVAVSETKALGCGIKFRGDKKAS